MAVEDVITGAAVALAATVLAWWLQRRDRTAERRVQEDRLRTLLTAEIESNLRCVFISRRVERALARDGKRSGPPPVVITRGVFSTLLAGPTALPPAETLAVSEFFVYLEMFETLEKGPTEVHDRDPDILVALRSLWDGISVPAEEAGVAALEALGAKEAVARVKADAARP